MNTRQFLFIIITSILNCVSNVISDGDIERCKIDDENCILETANLFLKKYAKGNDDIGLPQLDPLIIEELGVIQDLNAVKVDGKVFDTIMIGLSKAKISKLKGFDTGDVEMRFLIPAGGIFGPYKIKGKILKLSIEGHGNLKITFTNMDVSLKFKLVNKTVDGKTYFYAEKPKMSMSITGGSAHLSHLGSIANSFINWSFVAIINAIKDTYCKPMSKIYLKKINSLLETVPIDELCLQQ